VFVQVGQSLQQRGLGIVQGGAALLGWHVGAGAQLTQTEQGYSTRTRSGGNDPSIQSSSRSDMFSDSRT
jgi:hypothetical protein